ncbi:hypothetical protein AB0J44_27665 [Streptomyces canus]
MLTPAGREPQEAVEGDDEGEGQEVSAGPRPDSQASRSAAERMILPSLSGRTVERNSGGPT